MVIFLTTRARWRGRKERHYKPIVIFSSGSNGSWSKSANRSHNIIRFLLVCLLMSSLSTKSSVLSLSFLLLSLDGLGVCSRLWWLLSFKDTNSEVLMTCANAIWHLRNCLKLREFYTRKSTYLLPGISNLPVFVVNRRSASAHWRLSVTTVISIPMFQPWCLQWKTYQVQFDCGVWFLRIKLHCWLV